MRAVACIVYIAEHRNLTRSCRYKQSFQSFKVLRDKALTVFTDTEEDWKMHSRLEFRIYLKNLQNFDWSTCGTCGMYNICINVKGELERSKIHAYFEAFRKTFENPFRILTNILTKFKLNFSLIGF